MYKVVDPLQPGTSKHYQTIDMSKCVKKIQQRCFAVQLSPDMAHREEATGHLLISL